MKALSCLLLLLTAMLRPASAGARSPILGQWITDQKNLIVEVYLAGPEYKAKIVWVADKAPESRLDDKNPDASLRSRKVIGMDVLQGFTYNEGAACWEGGHIYDATSGKTWSATAHMDGDESLVVRGYWGFQIFGKSLRFKRYR